MAHSTSPSRSSWLANTIPQYYQWLATLKLGSGRASTYFVVTMCAKTGGGRGFRKDVTGTGCDPHSLPSARGAVLVADVFQHLHLAIVWEEFFAAASVYWGGDALNGLHEDRPLLFGHTRLSTIPGFAKQQYGVYAELVSVPRAGAGQASRSAFVARGRLDLDAISHSLRSTRATR